MPVIFCTVLAGICHRISPFTQAPFLLVKPEGVAPEVLTRKVDLGILCFGHVCMVSFL